MNVEHIKPGPSKFPEEIRITYLQVDLIRQQSEKCAQEFEKYKIPNDARVESFNMLNWHSIEILELMYYYKSLWINPGFLSKADARDIEENKQRFVDITRFLFVACMSSVEFNIKKSIDIYGSQNLKTRISKKESLFEKFRNLFDILCETDKNILKDFYKYLKNKPPDKSFYRILLNCYEHRIILEEEFKIWETCLELRNAIVHNNSINYRNFKVSVGDKEYNLVENQMTRGQMDYLTYLILHLI